MRRLSFAIHFFALVTCLVTQTSQGETQAMPGVRRAVETIADPGKMARGLVLASVGRISL